MQHCEISQEKEAANILNWLHVHVVFWVLMLCSMVGRYGHNGGTSE
jgi:hypothetical protein